jgi:hypothetical protein
VSNAQAAPQHGQLHASSALIAFGSRRAGLIFCIRELGKSSLLLDVSGPAVIRSQAGSLVASFSHCWSLQSEISPESLARVLGEISELL